MADDLSQRISTLDDGLAAQLTDVLVALRGTGNVTLTLQYLKDLLALADGSVGLAKLAAIANNQVLGNVSGGSAAPAELDGTDLAGLVDAFVGEGASAKQGGVPSPGAALGLPRILRADGTWATYRQPYISGRLYSEGLSTTGTNLTPDIVYFFPQQIRGPVEIAGLQIRVTRAGSSGALVKFAVYAPDPDNGYFPLLSADGLLGQTDDISVESMSPIIASLLANAAVDAPIAWLATMCNDVTTTPGMVCSNAVGANVDVMGAFSVSQAFSGSNGGKLSAAQSYASGFPTSALTFTDGASAPCPAFLIA